MRIVLSPIGTSTEIQPFLVLGSALRARGHAVTFCVPEKYRSWMINSDFLMFSSGAAFDELLTGAPNLKKEREKVFRHLISEVTVQFAAMRDSCKEADLLVGGMLQLAGASVAEKNKIPYINMVYSPFYLEAGNNPPFGYPVSSSVLNLFHQRTLSQTWNVDCRSAVNRERKYMGLPAVESMNEYAFHSGHLLLAFDPELAPVPQLQQGTSTVTGSLFPEQEESPDADVEQFLATNDGPIYFHLGTLKSADSEHLGNTCMEVARTLKKRALFSSGWISFDPRSVSPGFLRVNTLPQAVVLSRCSLLVHDGTASVTAAAVRAGIPQLIVASFADQMFWGKALESKGLAAKPIQRAGINGKKLRIAIHGVLENTALKTKVQQFAERLHSKSAVVKAVELIEMLGAAVLHRV